MKIRILSKTSQNEQLFCDSAVQNKDKRKRNQSGDLVKLFLLKYLHDVCNTHADASSF